MVKRPLRYLSVCSGIEAATQAWHPLGWKPVAFSEIEPFPCAVLAHHYPDVPNWGDMTKFQEWPDADVDVLCGGTPCQSFSVAGLRQGLADPRGNLMLTYLAVAERYRPRWVAWENVPGVFSSTTDDIPDPCAPDIDLEGSDGPEDGQEVVVEDEHDGSETHALGCFLAGLSELGYGWAYRASDAQHVRTRRFPFAVPQRRRRVFVVGYLGDWRRAAAVLFDRESLSGHPAPRREAGKRPAPTIGARPTGGGGLGTDFDLDDGLIPFHDVSRPLLAKANSSHRDDAESYVAVANSGEVGYCLTASAQQSGDAETETLVAVAHALRGEGFDASEDGTGRGTPIIAIQERAVAENSSAGPGGKGYSNEGAAYTLEARNTVQAVAFAQNQRGELRTSEVALPLTAGGGKPGEGYPAVAFGLLTQQEPKWDEGVCPTLALPSKTGGGQVSAVAFDMRGREGGAQLEGPHDTANIRAADGGSSRSYVAHPWALRRLTPVECERLQGFPEIRKCVSIIVCLEVKSAENADAETRCTTGQNSALSAGESAPQQPVQHVGPGSSISHQGQEPHAALHVLIDYERAHLLAPTCKPGLNRPE